MGLGHFALLPSVILKSSHCQSFRLEPTSHHHSVTCLTSQSVILQNVIDSGI